MPVTIIPVDAAHKEDFALIWVPWLCETIGREPEAEDRDAMADPANYYGRSGGVALLAHLDDAVVGAVAVKGLGEGAYEICKLVVTQEARGHGVGRALVQSCLDFSDARGASALWLQSFRKLEVALALYRRMGFEDAPPPAGMQVLSRTEVVMRRPARGGLIASTSDPRSRRPGADTAWTKVKRC